MFSISSSFFKTLFQQTVLPPPTPTLPAPQSRVLSRKTSAALVCSLKHSPSRLEGEPGRVAAVAAQRAERPHDQFEARVVYVPQVDVFVRDLHGALPVDVQVRGGHQVHVETLCEEETQI